MVDKKFLFKMDMRNFTVGRFEPSYKVKRFTDDAVILARFSDMDSGSEIYNSDVSLNLTKYGNHANKAELVDPQVFDSFTIILALDIYLSSFEC